MNEVVDQPSAVRATHLPDERAVQEQLVLIVCAGILPGHMVPLRVRYIDLCGLADDALGKASRVEVLQSLIGFGFQEMDAPGTLLSSGALSSER